ncbi:DUF1294 domain-containing protein [Sporosarcina sp. BI001-red]|uniref:DUF1294 domain-containing protein n=1 Tax=Sporosarcina sp. BI001-red TaxID=2282866 RepID=UPI000E25C0BE|nr:DUF1294 domain-containing protein [Sporosarcina sp. BI001-red]REB06576.1 DUF1294 domain-containing protein [Sporosarcina sp. BI001-red]
MGNLGIEWIVFLSVWAFITMGYDKRQAKRKKRRVSEKNLWLLAIFGGGIGAYFGMQVFRHKTLHTSFRVGFLMIALLDMAIVLYLVGLRMPVLSQLF